MAKDFSMLGSRLPKDRDKGSKLDKLREPLKVKETNQTLIGASVKEKKRPQHQETKKVNTKIPRKLLSAFMIYCAQENRYQKHVFPEMIHYILEKYQDNPLDIKKDINGVELDFRNELEVITLEIRPEQLLDIKELKIRDRLKYQQIYAQAIIHYLEKHQFKIAT